MGFFDFLFGPPPETAAEKETRELIELYDAIVRSPFPDEAAAERIVDAYLEVLDRELSEPMRAAIRGIARMERVFQRPHFEKLTLAEKVNLRKQLVTWNRKTRDGQELLEELIVGFFVPIAQALPKAKAPSPFTVPFIYTVPDAKKLISRLFKSVVADEYAERGLFTDLGWQLHVNVCRASGCDPYKPGRLIHALDSRLTLEEVNETYLHKTPLEPLFASPVPLKLTHEDRFNHMHVVGGTGAGKTTLIERIIHHDIQSDDPPSIVLIDPHGDLVRKLTRADTGITDRLVLIDPRDIDHPPALNVFALNQERMKGYDDAMREQVTASVIETFDYLFSGLLGADLTAKQGVFFRYVARLMLTLPEAMGRNATVLDMLNLMNDPQPYGTAIGMLPEIPREFFMRDFMGKNFQQTKEQIRYRLQSILENPTLARLFTSPETKVDLFSELNRGSIILVDTAKDFLKGGSSTFGRIFISLTLQAILERAAIPEEQRKATFLFIDEAASYFDSNIDDFLNEARKYRCGIVLSHQYLDQATHGLRASLAANTGIKFVSGVSASDASAMAREMRTTADFIHSQPRLQFAAHIRNVTPQAVSIPIEPVNDVPQLSSELYRELLEANRAKVSLPPEARRDSSRPSEAPWPEEKPAKRQQKRRSAEDVSEGW